MDEALESLALDLLRIPSVTGHEASIAQFVQDWARRAGLHATRRAGESVALFPRPPRPGVPRVLLLGHLDTVPPAGEDPPRIEGDRIVGLGASDMKCADALLLHVLGRAAREAPRLDLVGVLYAREEGPYDASGLPEVAAAVPEAFEGAALALALEPTDNHLELGCLGTLHAWVRFRGRRAHSARPWEGENAIHAAAPLLSRVAALAPRDVRQDGLLFREVLTATMVDYEGARNVVPGAVRLNLNFRFGPDRSPEEAVAHLRTFVAGAVGEDALASGRVEIEVTDLCPSGRVCTGNPHLEALRVHGGPGMERRAKQAWTDVGRLSRMGIDAANFGPGSPSQAHQAGEWCSRARLERARELLHRWLWSG